MSSLSFLVRCVLLGSAMVLATGSIASPSSLTARTSGDTIADAVLGQPRFDLNGCNIGEIDADTLCNPADAGLDPVTGRIFVSDDYNNRVLGYPSGPGFTNGEPADIVLGQDNFTTDDPCYGTTTSTTICRSAELLVDGSGNLYVTDRQNKRVIEFDDPVTTDTVADRVFGQPDMFSKRCRLGASGMCGPRGLAFDAAGNLYVEDEWNQRILVFFDPLADQVADVVIGAPDFDTRAGCTDPPNRWEFCMPRGIDVDSNGTLWVADGFNHRVVAFLNPLTTDHKADLVLGQPNFATKVCNYRGVSALSLCGMRDVAVTADGTVYVADFQNSRVVAYFDPFGTDKVADLVFGQPTFNTSSCNYKGELSGQSMCLPRGLELDVFGNLYVADSWNNRMLRFDTPLQ